MAIIIECKVIPNAKKHEWKLNKEKKLLCSLTSQPEKGAANKELIKSLSKKLKIPQSDIEIISGLISRYKKIKIHAALTYDQCLEKIGIIERQLSLS